MSSVHVARQGFITKSALPSLTRVRGTRDISNTVLLLNGNGTNGAQNNTFIDGSTNNFTITRNGNTTQGTFSPFSVPAGNWSNYFDGAGTTTTFDTLITPGAANTAFDLSGTATVECWIYPTSRQSGSLPLGASTIFSFRGPSLGGGAKYYALNISDTGFLTITKDINNTLLTNTSTTSINLNQWTHIAWVRTGGSNYFYVNGVDITSTFSNPNITDWPGASADYVCYIGVTAYLFSIYTYLYAFQGYISNFRVVKGTAVYTSNFTPPTSPLTAITNTSLLTCRDNRFRDASTNNFAITRNGDVRVTAFSPFGPTAAYDAATNGGSGYFDGTGDFLSVASTSALGYGTGDFTIEFWIYPTSLATDRQLWDQRAAGSDTLPDIFVTSAGVLTYYTAGATRISGGTVTINQWQHVVLSRLSGTTRLFLNGAQVGSNYSDTNNYGTSALRIGIGWNSGEPFLGYIADARSIKGTGYSSITVPTAPLTAITNTSLLCNFTNAGIIDAAGDNVIETIGDTKLNTSIKQFGSASFEFDTANDGLFIPSSPDLQFLTGPFTIEAWVYIKAASTANVIVYDNRSPDTQNLGFQIQLSHSGGLFNASIGTAFANWIVGPTNLARETWHHIAVARDGNTFRLFTNGTQVGTFAGSSTQNFTNSVARIGYGVNGNGSNCYLDDLRVTKGIARYTANFTPPTAEFVITNDTVPITVTNAVYGVYQIA